MRLASPLFALGLLGLVAPASAQSSRPASHPAAEPEPPDGFRQILGLPATVVPLVLVPMGYPTGRWGVAPRRPVHEVSFKNRWGAPLGFEVPEPLWPPQEP